MERQSVEKVLAAGDDLDRLVGEVVFGIPANESTFVPKYSQDISAAWTVIEALKSTHNDIHIEYMEHEGWSVSTCQQDSIWATASTVEEAICLAALKVVGELQ